MRVPADLLCLVNNDFHQQNTIFELFEGLEVKNMEETLHANGTIPAKDGDTTPKPETNGASHDTLSNGVNGIDLKN